MKRIVLLLIIAAALCGSLVACAANSQNTMINGGGGRNYLFLAAGFDDAAENTDVLFTLGIDTKEKTVKIAQIPRDTYFNFGGSQNKINQYYGYLCSSGEEKYSALEKTAESIAAAFGTDFDGFIGITTDGFCDIIDCLGGVEIYSGEDAQISVDGGPELTLKPGYNHIDGREAEAFVRFRSGYLTADLGRMDAQKIFLTSLFRRVMEGLNVKTLFSISGVLDEAAITNIKFVDVATIIFENILKSGDYSISLVTVPGEPLQKAGGLSYYVLNRKNGAEIAKRYMFADKAFDKNMLFCNFSAPSFKNAYEDENATYREYDLNNIKEIVIPKKQ